MGTNFRILLIWALIHSQIFCLLLLFWEFCYIRKWIVTFIFQIAQTYWTHYLVELILVYWVLVYLFKKETFIQCWESYITRNTYLVPAMFTTLYLLTHNRNFLSSPIIDRWKWESNFHVMFFTWLFLLLIEWHRTALRNLSIFAFLDLGFERLVGQGLRIMWGSDWSLWFGYGLKIGFEGLKQGNGLQEFWVG